MIYDQGQTFYSKNRLDINTIKRTTRRVDARNNAKRIRTEKETRICADIGRLYVKMG